MTRVVYDAGALIAAERGDRWMWRTHKVALLKDAVLVTTAPVVAQVSRSPRQARLHRFLGSCDVIGFVAEDAHAVGKLLAGSGSSDVVDAHLALVADGGHVLTSDPADLQRLAECLTPAPIIKPLG